MPTPGTPGTGITGAKAGKSLGSDSQFLSHVGPEIQCRYRLASVNGNTGPWASPPSKPMLDREGAALKDAAGKLRYSPIIEFASREIRDRWSSAVIDAMQAAHPEVFS